MPFIDIKINQDVSTKIIEEIKTELGKDITLIRGKSEDWLMINFSMNNFMYFKGKNEPLCMVEVKLYGKISETDAQNFTAKATNLIASKLDIDPYRIYVSYFETDKWGYGGENF